MVGTGRIIEEFNIRLLAVGEWLARMVGSWTNLIGLALMLVMSAMTAAVAWVFPAANWDMLAYLAAAYEAANPGATPEMIHAHAYETMRANTSEGDFLVLTEDRDYRIAQYTDPAAFFSMLGFYRVKLAYVEGVAWLSNLVDPYTAMRLMSVVPALLTGLVATLWLARERALHLAPLALALLMIAQFGEIARQGTPDSLSAFLFVAGVLAFLARRELVAAVLLYLAFLARPDHIAYLGVLMVVAVFVRSFSWGAAAAFFAALVTYFPMTAASGHPGWWVHMWFTNIEYVHTIDGFDPDFSLASYFYIQARVLVRSLVEESWIAVLIIGGFAWWQMSLRGFGFANREKAVLVTTFLAIGAKTVIFPLYDTRFYFPYLVVFGLVLIGALRDVRFLPPVAQGSSAARR